MANKILVIAEKPSVAQSIAKALGVHERKDGYIEGNGYVVSWCIGHLVALADADMYDEKYKKYEIQQHSAELLLYSTHKRYSLQRFRLVRYFTEQG